MKFFLLSLTAIIGAIGLFDSKKYDYLDISGNKFDISWDDITGDLWP
ncbi:hypothetical protein [Persicitalea jodogahamensis]|uniref:Uncharacterized protein n=1 Tax=Persicitalea jodogahamensis TaxID=402147 RepID=A0A8J3GC18_9BACT|nr:hypothetical protein [Persicitalea jodogahamensis]GHB85742.1 hypothetical protein GCM10007390_46530 [Persicitalea jodogahamensis]